MNEGMAMYLQTVWEAEQGGPDLDARVAEMYDYDDYLRGTSGPPAAWDPMMFGDSNIYYIPAVMYHDMRAAMGDDAFWSMVRDWPAQNVNGGATSEEYIAYLAERSGLPATFFDDWLYSTTTPAR
jgi:aminopeptidase N